MIFDDIWGTARPQLSRWRALVHHDGDAFGGVPDPVLGVGPDPSDCPPVCGAVRTAQRLGVRR